MATQLKKFENENETTLCFHFSQKLTKVSVLLVTIQEVGLVVLIAEEEGPCHNSGWSNVEQVWSLMAYKKRDGMMWCMSIDK